MVSLERCVPMDGDKDEQAGECSFYLLSNPPLIQAHQNMCSSICIKNSTRLTFIFFFLLSVRCRLRLCMGTRMNTQLGKVSEIWICHWIFLSFEHQKILFLTVFGRSLLVFPASLCFFLSAHSFFRSHLSADSLSCYCFLCVYLSLSNSQTPLKQSWYEYFRVILLDVYCERQPESPVTQEWQFRKRFT